MYELNARFDSDHVYEINQVTEIVCSHPDTEVVSSVVNGEAGAQGDRYNVVYVCQCHHKQPQQVPVC
mgnify:CR=1